VDADTQDAATTLLQTYEKRLGKWVRGTEVKPWKPPKPRDLQKTREQVQAPLPESVQAELVKGLLPIDPALAVQYQADLLRARDTLSGGYPLETLGSVMGPEEFAPAWDKAQRWLAVVAVVEDPDRILDEIESGALEPAQVSGFRTVYPSLWTELYAFLMRELASMRAESMRAQASGKPATTLPNDRETTIRLFGETGFSTPLKLEAPEKKEEPPPPKPKAEGTAASEQQTQSERVTRPL
jgi:hypothetical protein